MSQYLSKIVRRIEKDGFSKTTAHVCKAGAQHAAALPHRLRRHHDMLYKLPRRIKIIKKALINDKDSLFQHVRKSTLTYIASNHRPEVSFGAYAYKTGGQPILYSSCYAALTKHLYGTLDELSDSERRTWARYIQGFQAQDGLFHDPVIDIPLAGEIDWWGWRHLTLHVLMTITALGAVAVRPFTIIKPF